MTGAGDDHQGRVDSALLKCRVQLPTLADRDGGVLVAVDDQEGRVIPGDVGDGADDARASLRSRIWPPRSRDPGESGASCLIVLSVPHWAAMVRRFAGPKMSHTAWTRLLKSGSARLPQSFTSPLVPSKATRCPPAEPPKTPKWSGSRPYSRGIGPQPADGGLAVLDLGGERRVLASPIVDAGDRVPAPQECIAGVARRLAPAPPGTAVDPDDQRAGCLALGRSGRGPAY